ncbi:hypothetical protein RISW2_10785 [Roseivivax isoporae LMG 25204]|uniref:Uncharacterized protein n=1 Tax=Roseivivax isoporae LMG 25204 TaxID=1449351 RepID=X7F4R3_9RHOB|nr:hypothetical protein RISW2_10785 [Roseivivax isoporae LMG 25204]
MPTFHATARPPARRPRTGAARPADGRVPLAAGEG